MKINYFGALDDRHKRHLLIPLEDCDLDARTENALKAIRPDLGPREMLLIHLLAFTEEEILKQKGVGKFVISITEQVLHEHGFAFGDAEFIREELDKVGADKQKIFDILKFDSVRLLANGKESLAELKLPLFLNDSQNVDLTEEFLNASLRDDPEFQQEVAHCRDKLAALAKCAIQKKFALNKPAEPS